MKQLFTLMAFTFFCINASAQKEGDSIRVGNMIIVTKGEKKNTVTNEQVVTKKDTPVNETPADTIRVGNILIARDGKKQTGTDNDSERNNGWRKWAARRKEGRQSNVSTNWFILDLGFSNYINQTTNYGSGEYLYNRAGAAPLGENDFDLNVGKSINVNIWIFMQRLNLIKHHVNLKYGLGLELNNYRYSSAISYLKENPFVTGVAPAPTIIRDSLNFSKNKLAADYITVPLMINYSTNPHSQNKGFSISLGVSAGYLYSQRNKQVSSERGKKKINENIGLEQFKLSYVGEVGLGPVRLYGSYSPNSFYKKQLDMRPYTVGIRLSNW